VAVQAWGPGGYNGGSSSNWSTVASFTLSSTPPTVPTGLNATNISTPTPTFTWNGVDNGVWHHILVTKTSDNSVVLNKWFSGYDLNCTSSGQTCTLVSPSAIANGSYSWRVQVWGPAGFNGGSNTVWSTAQAMTVNVPTPAAINRIAPTDGATVSAGNVTLQWQADANATWYRSIVKLGGTTVHDDWYDASLICSGGVCNINVNGLASGSYAWWIAGWSQGGIGVWTGTSFTANP
jgi:hypothetical protein